MASKREIAAMSHYRPATVPKPESPATPPKANMIPTHTATETSAAEMARQHLDIVNDEFLQALSTPWWETKTKRERDRDAKDDAMHRCPGSVASDASDGVRRELANHRRPDFNIVEKAEITIYEAVTSGSKQLRKFFNQAADTFTYGDWPGVERKDEAEPGVAHRHTGEFPGVALSGEAPFMSGLADSQELPAAVAFTFPRKDEQVPLQRGNAGARTPSPQGHIRKSPAPSQVGFSDDASSTSGSYMPFQPGQRGEIVSRERGMARTSSAASAGSKGMVRLSSADTAGSTHSGYRFLGAAAGSNNVPGISGMGLVRTGSSLSMQDRGPQHTSATAEQVRRVQELREMRNQLLDIITDNKVQLTRLKQNESECRVPAERIIPVVQRKGKTWLCRGHVDNPAVQVNLAARAKGEYTVSSPQDMYISYCRTTDVRSARRTTIRAAGEARNVFLIDCMHVLVLMDMVLGTVTMSRCHGCTVVLACRIPAISMDSCSNCTIISSFISDPKEGDLVIETAKCCNIIVKVFENVIVHDPFEALREDSHARCIVIPDALQADVQGNVVMCTLNTANEQRNSKELPAIIPVSVEFLPADAILEGHVQLSQLPMKEGRMSGHAGGALKGQHMAMSPVRRAHTLKLDKVYDFASDPMFAPSGKKFDSYLNF